MYILYIITAVPNMEHLIEITQNIANVCVFSTISHRTQLIKIADY